MAWLRGLLKFTVRSFALPKQHVNEKHHQGTKRKCRLIKTCMGSDIESELVPSSTH